MKKTILTAALALWLTVPAFAYGDTYPTNAPFAGGSYVEVLASMIGRGILYVPIDYKDFYFSTVRGNTNLINISNSTITGQLYYGSNYSQSYQVRFQRFGTMEYYWQYSPGYWRWDAVSIDAIYNTNMLIANQSSEPVPLYANSTVHTLLIIFLLGVIVVCLFFKRFRTS